MKPDQDLLSRSLPRPTPPARPRGSAWRRVLQAGWLPTLLLGLVALSGCGRDPAKAVVESDANGYFCRKCNLKFYTERKVFAEHCPQCKSTEIRPVVAYVCSRDGHVTLGVRGPSAQCAKCGALVEAFKLPSAADLRAWGAVQKTRRDVCK